MIIDRSAGVGLVIFAKFYEIIYFCLSTFQLNYTIFADLLFSSINLYILVFHLRSDAHILKMSIAQILLHDSFEDFPESAVADRSVRNTNTARRVK